MRHASASYLDLLLLGDWIFVALWYGWSRLDSFHGAFWMGDRSNSTPVCPEESWDDCSVSPESWRGSEQEETSAAGERGNDESKSTKDQENRQKHQLKYRNNIRTKPADKRVII